jgi:hypothetical protein
MTVAQYYAYLNSTYANDAATRGQLAGVAYRFQQYVNEGFDPVRARAQAQAGKEALIAAKNEATNIGGLT